MLTNHSTINSKSDSKAINQYVRAIAITNKKTGIEYLRRLLTFDKFIRESYHFSIDELTVNKLFECENIYQLLADYVSYLINKVDKNGYKLSNVSVKQCASTVRNFLEYYDIDINPRKFKLKIKFPRIVREHKEAITKEKILKILETCSKFKLKCYILFLAATGCRAGEACSIRLKDIDFKNSKVTIRGEFTKTKVGRYVFLTEELKDYLKKWLQQKYRERRVYIENRKVKPIVKEDDLVFSSSFSYDGKNYNTNTKISEINNIENVYTTLVTEFNKIEDQLKIGYENAAKRRRVYTLHSLRRFVKSTISDLGYSDFSEWAIGHAGSTYYRKSDKEKFELFKKIEPYLTFLDHTGLEKRGVDLQNRLEIMEHENLNLQKTIHEREVINNDAIGSLSDQLLKVVNEIEELKKEQSRARQRTK
jgi:integrase